VEKGNEFQKKIGSTVFDNFGQIDIREHEKGIWQFTGSTVNLNEGIMEVFEASETGLKININSTFNINPPSTLILYGSSGYPINVDAGAMLNCQGIITAQ
jgi:hypothetical protein